MAADPASDPASDPGLLGRLLRLLNPWAPAEAEAAQQEAAESDSVQRESAESESVHQESAESESVHQERPECGQDQSAPSDGSDCAEEPGCAEEPAAVSGPSPAGTARRPPAEPRAQDAPPAPLRGKGKNRRARGKGAGRGGDRAAAGERAPSKKPPMRTARDVISRIQWDRNLPEDYFDIGYLDRFLGVVEKPFGSFTWGDLPWQDYDVLAIPQHRIQYFKYRDVVVWDKARRYDAVFGSSGSEEEIEAAMTRIDAEVEAERQRRAEEAVVADPFADDDDESDDGEVAVAFQAAVPAGVAGVPEEARSTHFLAVRVTCAEVQRAVGEVQAAVVAHEPELAACVMRPTLLHITLCMVRLEDQLAVAAAGRCLRAVIDDMRETLRADDGALRMRGLKTFGARVLYAPVAPCSAFSAVAEELRLRLARVQGARLTNAFDYVPHLTVLKVSRPVARARRSRFIDPAGYAAHEHTDFGMQRFDNVHLCAIDADCALDGFYVTESSVTF
ncbi:leukocyte receptor cluster member 9-like [Pollicipes pollicipes]|uniref:leukocyte receptor cluster member 9-like n=1 Tax=Pollicipes pollicipes TaxID=41117 RepID=UPI00188587D4|nr:leukocyte receptor cluster member 9-like [Pollicipes pollicipes]